jgi:UDP-galactopyranose mutase
MRVNETEISEEVVENVEDSVEYTELLEEVRQDFEEAEVTELRGYDSQDETVDNTIVYPLDNIGEYSFGSLAFGVENGNVTKASATLHFNDEDEDETRIRDYRYLHEDEEFYTPEEDKIVEYDERDKDSVEVIEYYQDK